MTTFPHDAPPPGFHLYFEDGRWRYALHPEHQEAFERQLQQRRIGDPAFMDVHGDDRSIVTNRAWACHRAWRNDLHLPIVDRGARVPSEPRTEADAAWEAKGESDKYAESLLVDIAEMELHRRELERRIRAMESDDAVLKSFRGTVADLKEQLGHVWQQRKDSGAHLVRVRDALHKNRALINNAKTLVVSTPLQSGGDMGLWFAGILEEAEKLTEQQLRGNEEVRKPHEPSPL